MRRRAAFWVGLALVGLACGIALLALVWLPADPLRMDFSARLLPPLSAAPLGTDAYGRDVAALLMRGAWTSLAIAVAAIALGLAGGVPLGLAAAAWGGWRDEGLMRLADILFAFPAIISAIMLAAWRGPGFGTAALAIGLFNIPVFARLTRAGALPLWQRGFIQAARLAGRGPLSITLLHILPNIAGLLVVQISIQLALAILAEAGLAYLGVSAPPPTPSWGRMLADSQTYLERAPWLVLLPGAAIALTVLGFNLLGDALRDRLDPRQRRLPEKC